MDAKTGELARQELASVNPQALLIDDMDAALVGHATRCGQPALAVYDPVLVLELLERDQGMDREGALEWFTHNIEGAWMGPMSPLFLHRPGDLR